MAKVKANGIELAYRTDGTGEPMVLIAGFTMVKESWALQIDELAKHFRVIAFDNRGVGESTVPSEPFTIADMAADTVALLDALGIESAHFFGVSMGGLITQVLALDYPDHVKKIALGCTTHGGKHAVQPEQEVMATLAESADPNISAEEAIRKRIPVIFSEQFIKTRKDRIEEHVQMGVRYAPTPEGASGQMGALSVFNVKRRLSEIRCPVLVITGNEDRMMPPENSRLLAQGIPGARLCMLDGAGHAFYLEKPEEVNRALLEFFSN